MFSRKKSPPIVRVESREESKFKHVKYCTISKFENVNYCSICNSHFSKKTKKKNEKNSIMIVNSFTTSILPGCPAGFFSKGSLVENTLPHCFNMMIIHEFNEKVDDVRALVPRRRTRSRKIVTKHPIRDYSYLTTINQLKRAL